MQAVCSVLLSHSKSVTVTHLYLRSCKISDEQAQLLATVFYRVELLERLELINNDIHDSAIALVQALLGLPELKRVELQYNPISASAHGALDKKTHHTRQNTWGGGDVFWY